MTIVLVALAIMWFLFSLVGSIQLMRGAYRYDIEARRHCELMTLLCIAIGMLTNILSKLL